MPLVDASEASRLLEVLCTLRARRPDLVHEVDVCVLVSAARGCVVWAGIGRLSTSLAAAAWPTRHPLVLFACSSCPSSLASSSHTPPPPGPAPAAGARQEFKLGGAVAPGQHTAALQAMATLARNLTADGDDAGNNLFLQAAKIVSKVGVGLALLPPWNRWAWWECRARGGQAGFMAWCSTHLLRWVGCEAVGWRGGGGGGARRWWQVRRDVAGR